MDNSLSQLWWQKYYSWILPSLGVMVAALAAYLPTVAPSISWRNGGADSGDLAAAVATLGIPHPPGYPTYILLGRLWTLLPLGGDVAYRLNLLSAISTAAAAGLCAVTILLLARKLMFSTSSLAVTVGALLGGLALALAPLTWSQATITEVYGPGLVTVSLVSLLMLYWWYNPDNRWSLLLAGLMGALGLGILPQIILLVPGALLVLAVGKRRHLAGQAWRWFGLLLLAACLGLTIFSYLPMRAAVQPLVNWGNPVTLANFWTMVSMAPYHQYADLLSLDQWISRLFESIGQLGKQLTWTGLGLAFLGGYRLWRYDRVILANLAILVGATLLFRTSYPVVGNIVYLLPALYGIALLIGLGAIGLMSLVAGQVNRIGSTLLGASLLIALGLRAMSLAPLVDASASYEAVSFGQQVLADVPLDAVVISSRDETTFSLWYQQALGQRLDVVVLDNRLICYDWYRHNLSKHYPDMDLVVNQFERVVPLNRPVYELVGPLNREAPQLLMIPLDKWTDSAYSWSGNLAYNNKRQSGRQAGSRWGCGVREWGRSRP